MKVKKHQLFFWVGFALFAASFTAYLVWMGIFVYGFHVESPTLSPDEQVDFGMDFSFLMVWYIGLVGPSLLVELSCIRSIYRILKYEPKGIIRICWLISAVLSFFAFVFQILVFRGVVDLTSGRTTVSLKVNSLLLTEIPVAIVSFLLCSIHKKQNNDKEQDNECSIV